jgi:peptidoglycan/LPS O-acetylase OafA/YrhL
MKPSIRRDIGLDYMRVAGLFLVVWQHSCSVLSQDRLTDVGSLNLGQLGVSFFLILSGYLASHTNRKPVNWAIARLQRLYPPYWLAIVTSLLGAWVLHYKPITVDLVLAELAGIAWFTHGSQIVNIPTWFISFLLLCYLIAFILRYFPAGGTVSLLTAVAISYLAFRGFNSLALTHLSTFLIGYWIGGARSNRTQKWLYGFIAVTIGLSTIAGSPWALYSGLAILVFGIALQFERIDPYSRRLAESSYLVYLVHGPILLATTILVAKSWWAVLWIGLPAVAIGTALLAIGVDLFGRSTSRLFHLLQTEFALTPVK